MITSPTPVTPPLSPQKRRSALISLGIGAIILVTLVTLIARSTISPPPTRVPIHTTPKPMPTRIAVHVIPSSSSSSIPTSVGVACGITRNAQGVYSFAWLHVNPLGEIINAYNCRVPLYGWNSVGAFLGKGGAVGVVTHTTTPLLHGDIVRVAFNERWYVENVYVPDQHMHYQAWLQFVVHTLEQRGNYVVLDADTAFFEPPCGNDGMGVVVTFCPAQGQGMIDYANSQSPYYHNVDDLEMSQPIALQALTLLATLYTHDPAVIFDVWNEPGPYIFVVPHSQLNRTADMNERIQTVRSLDPQSLVIVFTSSTTQDLSYTEPDLVFDFHIYPTFKGISPVTHQPCNTTSPAPATITARMNILRQAGRAIFIGEWGGCYDEPTYNAQIVALAKQEHASMTYFTYDNLVHGPKYAKRLNANGQLVLQDYAALFAQ